MISSREIYYLNKALDGKEIFGISVAQSFVENLKSEISTVGSLIKKEILTKDGDLNELSFGIIRDLEEYKKAEQYINFNNIFVSIKIAKDYCVAIKKINNSEFKIERIAKLDLINYFVKNFKFLSGNDEVCNESIKIEYDDFLNKHFNNVNEDEWFYLKSGYFENAHIFNIYFINNGVTYKYNVINKKLISISPKAIRIELLKLFRVRGSYKL